MLYDIHFQVFNLVLQVSATCPEFISATVINKSGAQETVKLPTYVLTNKVSRNILLYRNQLFSGSQ